MSNQGVDIMIDQSHLYKEHEIKYGNGEKDYNIYHMKADEIEGCSFDCLVVVPRNIKNNAQIVVKSLNTGSPTPGSIKNVEETILDEEEKLEDVFNYIKDENAILIEPLIIQRVHGPYYQHLTRDSLLDTTPGYERVDVQVVNAINAIRENLLNEDGMKTKNKIDLVGFSASGGFAQRFMFLHPEIIRAVYAGGAMDGIPLPIEKINGQNLRFPLGTVDYEEITGKKFNMNAFRKIKMRFSYGAKEKEELNHRYHDENGNPVSNFDMSYIRSITPEEDGRVMREIIGRTPEERFEKTIELYKRMRIDIETDIYPELGHKESKESKQAVRDFFKRVSEEEKDNKRQNDINGEIE